MPDRQGRSLRPRPWTSAQRHWKLLLLSLGLVLVALSVGAVPSHAAKPAAAKQAAPVHRHGHVTNAQRLAAAQRAAALRAAASSQGKAVTRKAVLDPNATPDYFGTIPNYANSPLPRGPYRQHRRHQPREGLWGRRRQSHHH